MSSNVGPDKGHAWVIAMAACVITMILSGISKMVGILYVAVIDTYGVTRQEATLPFTFRKSFRCLTGPVVGILGQRYGIRAVTLGGAVVAALGAALCFLAPSVTWLAVCWGGVHGLGEAFANTLFQVVVNQYFKKYRSTASGIALSGACVGSVCFSFLIEALREAYGLQGTFLILSGVILNVLPAAILLRPPSWIKNGSNSEIKKVPVEKVQKLSLQIGIPEDYIKSNQQKKMSCTSLKPYLYEKNEILNIHTLPTKAHSIANLVTSLDNKLSKTEKEGYDNIAFAMEMERNPRSLAEKRLSIQNVFATSKESLYEKVPSIYNLHQESLKEENLKEDSSEKNNAKVEETAKSQSIVESIKTIARLYTNPVYVLICVCMSTYVLIFIPIMTSIVDYSKDKGLPETIGKYLIHSMAVGDIIGRLCFGWVTDKEFLSIPRFMTLTLVLEGICILMFPFSSSLAAFMILLALYSMTCGSMLVRLPVLVLKHVKKDEHSVAMGCYGFVSGLVPLGIPSLIGFFRDDIGSYDGMFYLMGSLCVFSGGFWLLEPVLARINERKQNKKEDQVKA